MSRRDELATKYADNLYQKHGCSPNTDGKWLTHKTDFISGVDAAIEEVREELKRSFAESLTRGMPRSAAVYKTVIDYLDSLTEGEK